MKVFKHASHPVETQTSFLKRCGYGGTSCVQSDRLPRDTIGSCKVPIKKVVYTMTFGDTGEFAKLLAPLRKEMRLRIVERVVCTARTASAIRAGEESSGSTRFEEHPRVDDLHHPIKAWNVHAASLTAATTSARGIPIAGVESLFLGNAMRNSATRSEGRDCETGESPDAIGDNGSFQRVKVE
jgi:hypothetical protein